MNILGWYGAKEWQKQLFASIATLSLILSNGAGFFVAFPQVANAGSSNYSITGDYSVSGTTVSLWGTATAQTYTGQSSAQTVGVDWTGSCSASNAVDIGFDAVTFTDGSGGPDGHNNGNFVDATWSTSHDFGSAGSYDVCVKVYHASFNGAEGSDAATFNATIVIPATATLTLVKSVTNDNGGTSGATDWTLTASSTDGDTLVSGLSGSGDVTSVVVPTGTYDLSESDGPSGYYSEGWQCSGLTMDDEDTITLTADDDVTCTITNNDDAPTTANLTLIKKVINDNDGTEVDTAWTLTASSTNSLGYLSGTGTTTDDVSPGTYVLSESSTPTGYTASDWQCTGATVSGGNQITLAADDVAVCTITNDDVVPDTATISGTKFNDADGDGDPQATDGDSGISGWEIRVYEDGTPWTFVASTTTDGSGDYSFSGLPLATYKVCEASQSGWEQTFVTTGTTNLSPNSGEEEPECQTTTLNTNGEELTRNFGNYQPPTTGTITVNKVLINDDGGSTATTSFSFLINGSSETSFEADGSNELTLSPDTYTITEVSTSGYYTTYEGCSDIELGAGDSAVCTITNDDINEVSNTYVVKEANLVTLGELIASTTLYAQPKSWFFYNDENDTIDNALGSFVFGPDTAPLGEGSAEISVTGTERRNLATYQLSGIALADITEMKFSTYNPSAGNGGSSDRAAYINFNVDFDGSDDWQKRLAFVPRENGSVTQDGWQEWDAIDGGSALWWWSGFASNGNEWPDGDTNEYRTWDDLVSSFPSLSVRTTDSWFGFRVGEPYADGYTENIDKFVLGVQSGDTVTTNTFNFEPTTLCSVTVVSDETNTVTEKSGAFAEALSFIHTAWTAVIDGASWIWGDNPVLDPTVDETQTFVKTFDWNGTIGSAVLEIATDNYYTVKLNGVEIASEQSDANNFKLETQDTYSGTTVTDYIISGTNTLEIVVTNKGVDGSTSTSNPAGVKYSLVITGVDEGDSCMNPTEPTTATVTMCKYDTEDNPLEGWTLLLSGDHVQDLAVSSNSSAGTSSDPLSSGISYIASVAGTWFNAGGSGGAGNRADAEYVSTDDWSSYIDGPSTKPNQLDLQVNNEFVGWGSYNSNHNYAYSFIPSVDGAAVFRVFDGNADSNTPIANWYNDNSGSLDVSLNEGYAGITEENGCVQFEDVPVGSYTVGEIMQEGWMNVSGLGYVVVVAGENTFNVVNDLVPPDAPTLTLVKESVDYDGTFGFSIEGLDVDYSNEFDIETLNGFGTSTTFSLEEGTYAVSEIVPTSWTLTNISCVYEGDGTSVSLDENSEQLTLAGGDVVMCTFVNETNCDTETEYYDEETEQCELKNNESYFDLELEKTVDHDGTPEAGETVTYTITVTNSGPDTAGNIVITDLLPNGVTYVSHDTSNNNDGAYDPNTGEWDIISLGDQGVITLTIEATIDEGHEGELIENFVELTSYDLNGNDTDEENNADSAGFTVEEPEENNGGGGGGPVPANGPVFGGGIVLGASTSAGEVLGESCGLYMDQHLRLGYTGNNAEQVAKLQEFLNKYGYGFVPITGFFGVPTENAVKAFQGDYRNEILTPWGINEPTGLVYLTTLRQINLIECPHLSLQIPPLVPWHLEGSSETFGQSETGTDTGVAAEQAEEEFVQEDDTAGSQTASVGDAIKGEKKGGFWSNVWNFFFGR